MLRWPLLAFLALSCSSEAGQRVVYLEGDSGLPDADECAAVGQTDCRAHPLGDNCSADIECAPVGQLLDPEPPVACISGRCTFDCNAASMAAGCSDIGGSCNDWRYPDGGAAGRYCTVPQR